MPHISCPSPNPPVWAQPGEWDWTVKICLIGSLLLGGSMMFPQFDVEHVHHRLHQAEARGASTLPAGQSACLADVGAVYRMIGPAAWDALPACDLGKEDADSAVRPQHTSAGHA